MGEGLASPLGEGRGGRRAGHQGGRGQSRRGREQIGKPECIILIHIFHILTTLAFIVKSMMSN